STPAVLPGGSSKTSGTSAAGSARPSRLSARARPASSYPSVNVIAETETRPTALSRDDLDTAISIGNQISQIRLAGEPELVPFSSIELDLSVRTDPSQARPVATSPGRVM